MSAGMIITAVIIGCCLIWMTAHKIRHGSSCCGEREELKERVRAADRNPKHYPYHYEVQIEGMVCGRCVRSVENAFHVREGMYAKADLGSKTARVHAKSPISKEDAVNILKDTTYTIIEFIPVK